MAAGRLISAIRLARGLTQRDVAARLGRSRPFVSLIESGQRALRVEDAASWADALGVDPVLLERLVKACRGLLWRDGGWEFYSLGITDQSRAEGTWDLQLAHQEALDEVARLVNELADPLRDHRIAVADEEGVRVKWRENSWHVPIDFPLSAVALTDAPPQGTRQDVDQLLEGLSDQQLALTAAFVRGIVAQARTRIPLEG